ncbi:MAG: CapA family protein [Thermoleophilia bacterium]|jgi:hypothetical protein|nr:CapA family protein [Thermoleophilia bacterium]
MAPDRDPAQEARLRRREAARRQERRRRRTAVGLGLLMVGLTVVAIGFSRGGDSAPPAGRAAAAGATGTTTADRPPPPPDATVRIAGTGDIVMGSLPYGLPADGGRSFFRDVDPLIDGDVVVGNLEGTLATGGSSKCGDTFSPNCFAFRTPPSYSRWLKQAGFTVMNLANNHSYDFGAQGQRETLAALRRVGLKWTGLPNRYVVQTVDGVRVAVVGFAPYEYAPDVRDIPAARRLVARAAKDADLVVVTMHAGAEGDDQQNTRPGTEEYLGENRGDVMAFSKAVIDSGADLVIGHGPHVLRGMQFHRGRLIAYSMGNFGGYEVFALGGPRSTSGVLQVELRPDGTWVRGRVAPTRLVEPGVPARGGDAPAVLASLSREDFGAQAARIAADGTIRPPAR